MYKGVRNFVSVGVAAIALVASAATARAEGFYAECMAVRKSPGMRRRGFLPTRCQ